MINSGYIIHFDEVQRKELILDSKIDDLSFSDALSVHDWKIKDLQVVLLSFSGNTIDYICLATRGNRIATAKYRVEFSDLIDLRSIALSTIEAPLQNLEKLSFIKTSSGVGGEISPKVWQSVIELIKKERPSKKSDIDRLLALKKYSKYKFTGSASEILVQEREAFGMALDIFSGSNKLRKNILKSWAPEDEQISEQDEEKLTAKLEVKDKKTKSFMSGIPQKYIQEETAIQHDLFNWEDGKLKEHIGGVSRFSQGDRNLNVIYANKNDLEKTLGVDLIYYNEEFKSFVLVQYKLMREGNRSSSYLYRPDKQLLKEIQRMNDFHKKYNSSNNITSDSQLRLNADGFLFKLVPNYGLKMASEELVKGMYINREYMNFLLSKDGPRGERSGKIITFDNSPRYLTNTEFSSMVNRGWIGTNNSTTKIIQELIENFWETGRAVLIAIESIDRVKRDDKNVNT